MKKVRCNQKTILAYSVHDSIKELFTESSKYPFPVMGIKTNDGKYALVPDKKIKITMYIPQSNIESKGGKTGMKKHLLNYI